MGTVSFKYGNQNNYNNILKNDDTVYFVHDEDTAENKIYKGDVLYGSSSSVGLYEMEDFISNKINSLTLDEKIGQLFIIRPEQLCSNLNASQQHGMYGLQDIDSNLITGLNTYHPAGIIMFQKNVTTLSQFSNFVANYKALDSNMPFISIDEEGGRVARIANTEGTGVTKYESATSVAELGEDAVYSMGDTIGTYLAQVGVNVNFAPVADVNTYPDSPVIGTRCFGSDPHVVANMVGKYIDGQHAHNILTTIKHFPGHGDARTDSHSGYTAIEKTLPQMERMELIPFIANARKTDFIMAAHITTVNVEGASTLPASLSPFWLTTKLRNEYYYDGLIITDGMEMGAITTNYTAGEAAVMAIQAGCDIVLTPMDFPQAFNSVKTAVNNNVITQERLNESLKRIFKKKLKIYGNS